MSSLDEKRVLITGANAGIGLATAKALALKGAQVTIACRDGARGAEAAKTISTESGREDVAVEVLDLASLDSIEALSARLHAAGSPIDVLINNAGVATDKRTTTVHGFETMFGVNHLGHFHLTNNLLDLVEAADAGRIVVVSSNAHKFAKQGLDFDDLQTTNNFKAMKTYGKSKLANLLFSNELANRLEGSGVTVNAVHPGAVRTRLGRDGDGGRRGEIAMTLASPFFRSPDKGATASIYAASDDAVASISGGYFVDRKQVVPASQGRDVAAAARLWDVSEQLLRDAPR
jgi:NAD(P)-dependent dehydrogenase (short-subunit alcohol dehydrogenase family)